MAELSEQTEAILERLKAEGQLTRNTGTNSLKSVKVDLGKFTDVLSSVNSNIAEQTSIMRQTLDYNVQEAQRARDEARQDQLSEVAKKAEEKEKETQQKTEQEKKGRSSDATSIGGVLTNMLGGFKNFVIKSLLGAVGGIAIFELARGFFDERTGGEFSKFFDEIDWAGMTANLTSIATSIANGAQNFVNFIADPMGVILGSLSGPTVAGAAVTAAGLGGLLNATSGDDGDVTKRRSKLRNFVKLSALGLVLTGVSVAGAAADKWISEQEWSEEEFGKTGITKGDLAAAGVDVAQGVVAGATIGSMFGPGGTLIGALLGGTITLGFKALEFWNKTKRENELEMAAQLARAEALLEQNRSEFDKLVEDMSRMTPEQQEAALAGKSPEFIDAYDIAAGQNELAMAREQLTYTKSELDRLIAQQGPGGMAVGFARDAYNEALAEYNAMVDMSNDRFQARRGEMALGRGMTDAEAEAFNLKLMEMMGGGRGTTVEGINDRANYFAYLEGLANEAMLDRARKLGEAELMAGYINYGTQDQIGLSDYAQGFRRQGGVTFKIKTSYGDVTPKDVEEGLGFFGTIGKFFGFSGEDVSSGGRNNGRTIVYKEGDTNISAPQVTGGNNLSVQSNIGAGVSPPGSEFPGYGN
jgi:hypothetical protein